MRPIPPSGRQVELLHDDQRAVVVEVGGGIREYIARGWPLLDGYEEAEMCQSGRGQVLIPWPNRLQDGSYEWDGERLQLPLTELDRQNAIHGLVRWGTWTIAAHDEHRAVMEYVLHPQPGYPFTLALKIVYTLDDDGLSVQTTATNAGSRACPYGAGAHPYLRAPCEKIDDCVLVAPGAARMETDDRAIPLKTSSVAGTEYDFRKPRRIGTVTLDTAFLELQRGPDGLATVILREPADGRQLTLWMDEAYRYLQLFTGDSLPDPSRRRKSLAIEPMTCAPNAFRSGEGLLTLSPGESVTSRWGIEVSVPLA